MEVNNNHWRRFTVMEVKVLFHELKEHFTEVFFTFMEENKNRQLLSLLVLVSTPNKTSALNEHNVDWIVYEERRYHPMRWWIETAERQLVVVDCCGLYIDWTMVM